MKRTLPNIFLAVACVAAGALAGPYTPTVVFALVAGAAAGALIATLVLE